MARSLPADIANLRGIGDPVKRLRAAQAMVERLTRYQVEAASIKHECYVVLHSGMGWTFAEIASEFGGTRQLAETMFRKGLR